MAVLNEWTMARTKWAAAERPAIAVRQLFERIHALWTTIQREGDRVELVLGDGMLGVPDPLIRHPVLLQRVNLELTRRGQSSTFTPARKRWSCIAHYYASYRVSRGE
jgi:hypothetical protein